MSYSDFLSLIPARVRERLEGNPVITVRPILKNNGLKLDSLLILYPGENICPTIYLNPYYEAWKSGVPLDELLDEILDFYRPTTVRKALTSPFSMTLRKQNPIFSSGSSAGAPIRSFSPTFPMFPFWTLPPCSSSL